MRHDGRDDHAVGGLDANPPIAIGGLAPCGYRATVGAHLVCRHPRVRGYALDIVAPRTCQRCVWRNVPCLPRSVPRFVALGGWLLGLRPGDAVKRVLAALTFGLVRPRADCGCDRRRRWLNAAARGVLAWLQKRGKNGLQSGQKILARHD